MNNYKISYILRLTRKILCSLFLLFAFLPATAQVFSVTDLTFIGDWSRTIHPHSEIKAHVLGAKYEISFYDSTVKVTPIAQEDGKAIALDKVSDDYYSTKEKDPGGSTITQIIKFERVNSIITKAILTFTKSRQGTGDASLVFTLKP